MRHRALAAIAFVISCRLAGAASLPEDFLAADAAYLSADYPLAAELYKRATASAESATVRAEASFRGGEALLKAGATQEARAVFEALPGDPRAAFRLGVILLTAGRAGEAAGHFERIASMPSAEAEVAEAAVYFRARILTDEGKTDQALELLQKAAGPLAQLARADALASRGAAHAEAIEAYRAALADAPRSLAADIHLRIGWTLLAAGAAAEASGHFASAARDERARPYAAVGSGWAALAGGDAGTALREAEGVQAAGLGEQNDKLRNEVAFLRASALAALGRHGEASDILSSLLIGDAGGVARRDVLRRLAWSALAAGRYDLALRTARAMLREVDGGELADEALFVAAESELSMGIAGSALTGFERVRSGGGRLAFQAGLGSARALLRAGQAGQAAMQFDVLGSDAPPELRGYVLAMAARAHLAAGDSVAADARFGEAAGLYGDDPFSVELLWGRAVAAYLRNDLSAMAAVAERIRSSFPGHQRAVDAAYWSARARLDRREYDAAAKAFGEAAELAERGSAMRVTAQLEAAAALQMGGKADQALAGMTALIAEEGVSGVPLEAVLWTASQMAASGAEDRALDVLGRALEEAPAGAERHRLKLAMADLLRSAGRLEEALSAYETVLTERDFGARPVAKLGKARCLILADRPAEAEIILLNVLDDASGWPRAAAFVELGELRLRKAAAEPETARRESLAREAERNYMYVVLLYEPSGPGEGAELAGRALLGAARSAVVRGEPATARQRLEKMILHPLYGALPQAREARRLLQDLPMEAFR